MSLKHYRELFKRVQSRELSVDEAVAEMRTGAFDDIDFAKIDHRRTLQQGFPEVVYCEGKAPQQSAEIVWRLVKHGDGNILATRVDEQTYEAIRARVPDAQYHSVARLVTILRGERVQLGCVAVVSAGTSDIPVAEEAALTAETMGSRVTRIYDAGVAGLHRLLARLDDIRAAEVVVVVAGMEGALASVVGGLVAAPVIAVPTSIGYGANFGGLSALLSMLNSCSSGVTVVNIDNGFGAGYTAAVINRRIATFGQS